jgi:DNA-binding HxlR family transcriptional regulator
MQRTSFSDMTCSLARTLDVAGEWWTPLIVRDVWFGRTRFDEIQENLGLSRKLLADRLETLVREEILFRKLYQERPPRHEYRLTQKGKELMVVLLAVLNWGDRWVSGDGPPLLLRHLGCGEIAEAQVRCSECGEPLHLNEVMLEPGPGLRVGARGSLPFPERHPLHELSLELAKAHAAKAR